MSNPSATGPSNVDELLSAASKAHAAGRLSEAEALVRTVLEQEPQNPQAMLLLGVGYAKKGLTKEARSLLEAVAAADQTSFFARLWLSILAKGEGRIEEAIRWAREAVDRNPTGPMVQNQLGFCYLEARQFELALGCFQQAARAAPQVAIIRTGMAKALQGLGRHSEAIEVLKQASEIEPNSAEILTELIEAYGAKLDGRNALRYARRLVEVAPDSGSAHVGLARTLIEENLVGEAEEHARKAMELLRDDGPALAALGSVLEALGRIDEANDQFRRSIELIPRQEFAYFGLTHCHKIMEGERPLVEQMSKLAMEAPLPDRQAMYLRYALGKALDDLGDYQAAMSHYDEANRLAYALNFGTAIFNRQRHVATNDAIIRTFNRGTLNRHGSAGSSSDLPILVVGMMRSGTTLTEQILSCHPEVGAAGEQRFWVDQLGESLTNDGASLSSARLRQWADEYCALLQRIAPDRKHVVDKNPGNFATVGLIHAALPQARIIHVKRHPVDTCLSIYATPNRSRIDWTNNKENIVFAYQEYLRLMEHWRSTMP